MASKWIIKLGKNKGKWIRKGGLVEEEGYSQVNIKTHTTIAKMNELGMITFDSQDGYSSDERAYIQSFMNKDYALRFIEKFNLNTDQLALSVEIGQNSPLSRIPVTRTKSKAETRIPYVLDKESIHIWMNHADIPKKMEKDVVVINCIDTRWGYRSMNKKGLFNEIIKVLKTIH